MCVSGGVREVRLSCVPIIGNRIVRVRMRSVKSYSYTRGKIFEVLFPLIDRCFLNSQIGREYWTSSSLADAVPAPGQVTLASTGSANHWWPSKRKCHTKITAKQQHESEQCPTAWNNQVNISKLASLIQLLEIIVHPQVIRLSFDGSPIQSMLKEIVSHRCIWLEQHLCLALLCLHISLSLALSQFC